MLANGVFVRAAAAFCALALCLLPPFPAEAGASSQILIDETVSSMETSAVLTGVARLPCDLRPSARDDKVSLVIWYKDGAKSPIYSLDVRGRSLQQPTHWADEKTLGGRSFFRVLEADASPEDDIDIDEAFRETGSSGGGDGGGGGVDSGTHLAIENVRESDAGSYRCRVDFRRSPTRNSIVNLTVIVPPQNLTLLDEHGHVIDGTTLGPYTEGASATVTCISEGGRPRPRVTWWRDGALLDDGDEALAERRVHNTLRLERLQRADLGAQLQCRAENNKVLAPALRNLTLDMTLRPLEVRLLGDNQPLSAGSQYEVVCQAVGSRPPPIMAWRKAGLSLPRSRQTISSDGNVTTSILTLSPGMEDLGRELECSANNSHVAGGLLRDSWVLNIHYAPVVTLELGSNLNASSIREGVDVYFECSVRANPWIYKVVWQHNGRPLHNNASTGTILSNQTLVLQSVTRHTSGLYTCVASNSEGDVESNPFNLDVKC